MGKLFMKRIGHLWLFLWLSLEATEYKTQYAYGQELYNLLYACLLVDSPDNGADYVKKLLSNGTVNDIYREAGSDGYTHIEVIKAAYYISMRDTVIQPSIVKGIRAYLVTMKRRRTIYFYAWNVFVFGNLAMTVYCIRFFKQYFRFNLPDLTTYY